jgi:hypothetical protein
MQQVPTSGDSYPYAATQADGCGVYPNTPEMRFRFIVPGMPSPAGWGKDVTCRRDVRSILSDGRAFSWDAFFMDAVHLPQPVHLTLIEGASPLLIFMAARLEEVVEQCTVTYGPFLLLSVSTPSLHTVPYVLRDVVFGRLQEHLYNVKLAELLPAMLFSISNSPQVC